MKNIVYFLGAGASKNFGYPLTGDIMPEILQALRKNRLFNPDIKTEKVFQEENELLEFIYKIYPGLRTIDIKIDRIRIPNITEVLSIVDYCCFYNIPPHPALNENTLIYFRQLLNRAVGELLLHYERQPYSTEEKSLLKKFITPITQNSNSHTIITTNYDLIIDKNFKTQFSENKIDFGIPYRDVHTNEIVYQTNSPLFKYFKLHGSFNWLSCDLCGQYYINPNGSIIHNAFNEKLDNNNTCDCSESLRLKSVLITPSIVRDIRDSNLLQIWKLASESIRTADKLILVGYSMPGEDLAIKSIFMRGINGRSKKTQLQIDVVQYGESAKQNYLNVFGNNINYYSQGLKDYLYNHNF